jgi:hypothetical protein
MLMPLYFIRKNLYLFACYQNNNEDRKIYLSTSIIDTILYTYNRGKTRAI